MTHRGPEWLRLEMVTPGWGSRGGLPGRGDQDGVQNELKRACCESVLLVGHIFLVSVCCQDGSAQAQSNLTFLSILKEPYQELAHMHPKDIANKLPRLISLIRIIWVNSPYYNTRERLTSLFRKVCGAGLDGRVLARWWCWPGSGLCI